MTGCAGLSQPFLVLSDFIFSKFICWIIEFEIYRMIPCLLSVVFAVWVGASSAKRASCILGTALLLLLLSLTLLLFSGACTVPAYRIVRPRQNGSTIRVGTFSWRERFAMPPPPRNLMGLAYVVYTVERGLPEIEILLCIYIHTYNWLYSEYFYRSWIYCLFSDPLALLLTTCQNNRWMEWVVVTTGRVTYVCFCRWLTCELKLKVHQWQRCEYFNVFCRRNYSQIDVFIQHGIKNGLYFYVY